MAPVRAVGTGNLGTLSGTQTVGGVSVSSSSTPNRVLLTAQTTGSQNGIWIVNSGAWTRPDDYAAGQVLPPGLRVWDVNTGSFSNIGGASTITVDTSATTWPAGPGNPMTTLADLTYGGVGGVATRLPGDTSNTRKFLREQSSGGVAAAPAWDTLQVGDLPAIGTSSTTPAAIPVWIKITKTYADFSTTATSNCITIWTAPAGTIIHPAKINAMKKRSFPLTGCYKTWIINSSHIKRESKPERSCGT